MMEKVQLQQGVPSTRIVTLYSDEAKSIPLDITDKTVFISIKQQTEFSLTDETALITSKIITHTDAVNGETLWELTAAQTLIKLGTYKADIRAYVDDEDYTNSDTFLVEIVPVVTQRVV